MREQGLLTAPVQPYSFDCLEGDSVLKSPFAPISAPGSEAKYASFVVFWSCLWPHLDRRPGQKRLFQHADKLRRALLGSVPDAAAGHAHCPARTVWEGGQPE